MQFFVCQNKEKIDGASLRSFNSAETPKITAVTQGGSSPISSDQWLKAICFYSPSSSFWFSYHSFSPEHIWGAGIFPFFISFPSSQSLKIPRYFPWIFSPFFSCFSGTLPISFVFFHHILVIFSSTIFIKTFTNEKKKAYSNFWISDSQHRALPNSCPAHRLCARHGLALTSPPAITPTTAGTS